MGFQKHGDGQVLRDEDKTEKTAARDWTPSDDEALASENDAADKGQGE